HSRRAGRSVRSGPAGARRAARESARGRRRRLRSAWRAAAVSFVCEGDFRMNRRSVGVLALCAVVACTGLASLAGCSKSAPSAGGEAAGAQKPIVLGFSQIGAESEWRTANTSSIKSAAEAAGIKLKFSDAQQKQENQIKALRSFIAQRVDVIAFSPVVETGWETVLREAKAAKIPVILTDRAVDVSDDSL